MGRFVFFTYFSPFLLVADWPIRALIGVAGPAMGLWIAEGMFSAEDSVEEAEPEGFFHLPSVSWVVTAVVGLAIFWFSFGFFGFRPAFIPSGSMEPHINRGDLVLIGPVSPKDVKVGDIVMYQANPQRVLHRVVDITTATDGSLEFTFKGDNNNTADPLPVSEKQIVGRYIGRVPKLGWVPLQVRQLRRGPRELNRLDDLLAGLDRIGDDLDELRVTLRESSAVATLPPANVAQPALPFAATVASPTKEQSAVVLQVPVAQPHVVTERLHRHEERRERAGFVRKNGQRVRLAAVPIALGVALTCVAIVRLPPATTGWTESLTLDSAVGTGQFSCEQLKLTFNGSTPVDSNRTKYSYTLTGGGPNPITCKEIVWISLAVCSDLDPTTDVLNATPNEHMDVHAPGNGAALDVGFRWQRSAQRGVHVRTGRQRRSGRHARACPPEHSQRTAHRAHGPR